MKSPGELTNSLDEENRETLIEVTADNYFTCLRVAESIDLYRELISYMHQRTQISDEEIMSARAKLFDLCDQLKATREKDVQNTEYVHMIRYKKMQIELLSERIMSPGKSKKKDAATAELDIQHMIA